MWRRKSILAPAMGLAALLAIGINVALGYFDYDSGSWWHNSCQFTGYIDIDTNRPNGWGGYADTSSSCGDRRRLGAHFWNSSTQSWDQYNGQWLGYDDWVTYTPVTWEGYGYHDIQEPVGNYSTQYVTHVYY